MLDHRNNGLPFMGNNFDALLFRLIDLITWLGGNSNCKTHPDSPIIYHVFTTVSGGISKEQIVYSIERTTDPCR